MWSLVLALTVLAVPSAAPDGDRSSLEELLRRAREERARMQIELAPLVNTRIAALEALPEDVTREERKDEVASLAALGSEAAPLMVPFLEPGSDPERHDIARAQFVAEAMIEIGDIQPVLDDLLEMSLAGSTRGRRNAISVLGFAKTEAERVGPILIELFENAPDGVRLAALKSLARLGGEANLAVVGTALGDPNSALVAGALGALSETATPGAAPAVLDLVRSDRAVSFVGEIVKYYRNTPSAVDEDGMGELIRLAARAKVRTQDRLFLLNALPEFDVDWDNDWRILMEPLAASTDGETKEAALICLAGLGDSAARREVIKYYDGVVAESPRWPKGYQNRAEVYMRLREYRSAVKDFKKALEYSRSGPDFTRDLWIGLARAYVLDDKLRDAHGTLEKSPLSGRTLKELGQQKDFQPLVEHSKYGKVFGLDPEEE